MRHGTADGLIKALLIALGLAAAACGEAPAGDGADASTDADTDSDTDSDGDTDTGPTGGLVPIDSFGAADLDYDTAPLPDPKADLPPLEDLDPEVVPALAGQSLPDAATEILELDKALWYVGLPSEEALGDALRADGVVRQATTSSRDLMADSMLAITGDGEEPALLVTSDAVFNTFHNFYDNVLLGVELETLRPRVLAMLGAVKAEAAKRYNALPDGPTRDAALDVVGYLQVAESLMEPASEGIEEVWEVAGQEIALVDALGPSASPVFDRPEASTSGDPECVSCDPCASSPENGACGWYEGSGEEQTYVPCPERYCEDYSQYKPRGHYTYNEELERYFRAVMWLGRMTFLNRSDQSTRGAAVLIDSLKAADVEVGGEAMPAADVWRQAMRAIGAFVGSMDDLNAAEVDAAIVVAMGGPFALDALDDTAALDAIHAEIDGLHDPEIMSGYLNSLADLGQATKGLRLLGQVYLPDSYALGQLSFGNVGASATADAGAYAAALSSCGLPGGADAAVLTPAEARCVCKSAWGDGAWSVCRGLPSGLDVAAALGDVTAQALAHARFDQYAGYAANLDALIGEFAGFDLSRWGLSVAWTWLYALEALLEDVDPGAPAFMRTAAWEKKNLETGLTSWAELRHDTILYVKQSASGDADGDTDSDTDADYDFEYVEPQPAAYARLQAATRRINDVIAADGLLADDSGAIVDALSGMESFLARAAEISVTELEGEPLTVDDVYWIRWSGSVIAGLENGLLGSLGLMDPEEEEPDPDRLKTTIVADVHTFGAKGVVLEVGSGYLDTVAIVHRLPGGQWGVAVGPAFTYHELEHDMSDRLTDEQWREMLASDPDNGRPDWLE